MDLVTGVLGWEGEGHHERKQRLIHRLVDELDEAGAEVWSVRQG